MHDLPGEARDAPGVARARATVTRTRRPGPATVAQGTVANRREASPTRAAVAATGTRQEVARAREDAPPPVDGALGTTPDVDAVVAATAAVVLADDDEAPREVAPVGRTTASTKVVANRPVAASPPCLAGLGAPSPPAVAAPGLVGTTPGTSYGPHPGAAGPPQAHRHGSTSGSASPAHDGVTSVRPASVATIFGRTVVARTVAETVFANVAVQGVISHISK